MKLIADTPTTLSFLVVDMSSTTFVTIPLLPSLVGIVLVTVVVTARLPLPLLLILLLRLNLLPLSNSNSSGSSPKLLFSRKFPTLRVTFGTPAHVCCQSFQTVPTSTPANTASKLPSWDVVIFGSTSISCQTSLSGLSSNLPTKFATS